jgi:tetratricopeptide (TPR) repeat protein
VLTAFYDFSVSPTGFDAAVFLTLADLARQRRGFESFRVIFVPAPGSGFWSNESYDSGYKAWRLHHLLLPLTTLFPACRAVAVCGTRDEARDSVRRAGADIFPDGYTVENPPAEAYQLAYFIAAMTNGERWTGWQAPPPALAFVGQWLEPRAGGRKVVTITLREARYHIEHNSNRQNWMEFARRLDRSTYFPVFLRDTEAALDPLPEELRQFAVFGEASFNVALRAALYFKAHVNMMTASGPMFLTWLHPSCASIVLRMLNLADYRATPTSLRSVGLEVGGQPGFLGPHQRIVWGDDRLETIEAAFAEFERDRGSGAAVVAAQDKAFTTARRLRRTWRLGAARQIYVRLLRTSNDGLASTAATAALASIDWDRAPRDPLARLLALLRLPRLRWPAEELEHLTVSKIDADVILELVDWLLRIDRPEAARAICEQTLARHPESAELLRLSGEIELRLGRPSEALLRLARSAKLYPWSAEARYAHGVALLIHGREEEAKAEFIAAALDDGSHEAARLRLAALDPGYRLPDGLRYEDARARRVGSGIGVAGELPYAISVPEPRRGHRILWFHGLFHALPNHGLAAAGNWRQSRLELREPRWRKITPLLSRAWALGRGYSVRSLLLDRLLERALYRCRPADGVTAATLTELDNLVGTRQAGITTPAAT